MIRASLQSYPIKHRTVRVEGGGEGAEHLGAIQRAEEIKIKKIGKSVEADLH